MACEFCTEPIALDQPCMELLCHHKVHTECALRQAAAEDILTLRCPNCREHLVPRAMMDEVEAVHGQGGYNEVINYFWTSEPQFKTALEGIRDTKVALRRCQTGVIKKIKAMNANLEAEVEPLVEQIREKVRAVKATFKALPEAKEESKLTKSFRMKSDTFFRRWGVRTWQIARALGNDASARAILGSINTRVYNYRTHPRQFNVRIE